MLDGTSGQAPRGIPQGTSGAISKEIPVEIPGGRFQKKKTPGVISKENPGGYPEGTFGRTHVSAPG